MSKHSIQSKSFLVFFGMAMTLSACSNISANVATPTPRLIAAASPQRQTLKATEERKQTRREDYKAIALSKLGNAADLVGSEPKAIALRVFRNTEPERGKSEVTVDYNYPKAIVIVTHIGLADDSVRDIRYRAEFVATSNTVPSDQVWSLVWAGSQFKCRIGRGHQDWSSELCS